MKRILSVIAIVLLPLFASAQDTEKDWADYGRYADKNAALAEAPSVVFMGNSITQCWYDAHPDFFDGNNFACRGISGQVSSQMLCRFRADVIDLHPKAVVILAGTNDIARNNGFISPEHIAQNIESMVQLAQANGIEAFLCTVLPVKSYKWRPELGDVSGTIVGLNALLKHIADAYGCRWIDLYSATVNDEGGFDDRYTYDGVHPTAEGYDVLESILLPELNEFIAE